MEVARLSGPYVVGFGKKVGLNANPEIIRSRYNETPSDRAWWMGDGCDVGLCIVAVLLAMQWLIEKAEKNGSLKVEGTGWFLWKHLRIHYRELAGLPMP